MPIVVGPRECFGLVGDRGSSLRVDDEVAGREGPRCVPSPRVRGELVGPGDAPDRKEGSGDLVRIAAAVAEDGPGPAERLPLARGMRIQHRPTRNDGAPSDVSKNESVTDSYRNEPVRLDETKTDACQLAPIEHPESRRP